MRRKKITLLNLASKPVFSAEYFTLKLRKSRKSRHAGLSVCDVYSNYTAFYVIRLTKLEAKNELATRPLKMDRFIINSNNCNFDNRPCYFSH